MRVVVLDVETCLFRPGAMAPELVCLAYRDGAVTAIVDAKTGIALLRLWLSDPNVRLVGHNIVYDLAVACAADRTLTPLVFAAYEADRITDTMLRMKLLDISAGQYRGRVNSKNVWVEHRYDLASLTRRILDRQMVKDEWQKRYGELRHTPIEQWPDGARQYPCDDVIATAEIYEAQEEFAEALLQDQFRQARKAWCQHLTSVWGLRTRGEGVAVLRAQTEAARDAVLASLVSHGLVRADGSRDTKAAKVHMQDVCEAAGKTVRLTKTGNISLDADACEYSEDELLEEYAEYSTLGAVLAKDVPALERGTVFPIHTHFDLADSGRVTSAGPNIQNWRRAPGIRESFVPRRGKVFIDADYGALELCTLAQVCLTLFGESKLAEALNAGIDPHTELAARILGVTYEECAARVEAKEALADDARQTAKVANFGFPGGLGAEKLVLFARKTYGVVLTVERARELKTTWLEQWPEMRLFFAHVNQLCADTGEARVEQLFSRRVRGDARYTAACNTYFQGLGADATAAAWWLVMKACYVDDASPLFGCRVVNYIHDEFILECADSSDANQAAIELARLMIVGAKAFLPDVRIKVKPLLMRFWSKDAKPVYDDAGRLIPWEGKAAYE